jgi:hypothetical protein
MEKIMSNNLYALTVPIFVRTLKNLQHILQKGAAHAEANKIDPSVLVNFRLFPDMFPLSRQVQIATDMVKGCAARLAGVEIPSYADTETTFGELIERVQRTIQFLENFKPEQFDNTADKAIVLPLKTRTLEFTGLVYVQGFAIPNLYFHATTTYNILRHNGVALGKVDFLGQ